VWCELNAEGDALEAAIPGAVQVAGADTPEAKEERLIGFAEGKYRVLISKSKIAGFGLNLQICRNVAFVGVTHSYEAFFQSIRRCWRFGQKREVHVHLYTSEAEVKILENLQRKEADAEHMTREMVKNMVKFEELSTVGAKRDGVVYDPRGAMPAWLQSEAT